MITLSKFQELKKLPKRQRLKLAEELWFSGADDDLPVPEAHKQLLDQRWTAFKNGKSKPISMTDLDRRLTRK